MSDYIGPHNNQLNLAQKLWNLDHTALNFIRGNENWVYSYKHYIFRFTAKYHRNINELKSELEWITYLGEQGLPVSMPIKSANGLFVEEISDLWSCSVFKKAPGEQLTQASQFTKEAFLSWGKLTGAIHKVTRSFSPKKNQRHQWDEDDGYLLGQQALKNTDKSHPMAIQYVELLDQIKGYEKTTNGFGLIHGDFHHGNFHYDIKSHQITLFDFDDSNYFWYVFDLVVPFASLELSKHFCGLELKYKDLQQYFMDAYHKEYSLDSFWLDQIPTFAKYRFVSLYFWSKGRALHNRINNNDSTQNFMDVCQKLTSEISL